MIYVRTDLTVEGLGQVIHVAELEEAGAQCQMLRLIELAPDETVAATSRPDRAVPHPDTYGNYEGITASYLTAAEFEALWARGN